MEDIKEVRKKKRNTIFGNSINLGLKLGGFQASSKDKGHPKGSSEYDMTIIYFIGGISLFEIREFLSELDR